jgi:hypothetical protein
MSPLCDMFIVIVLCQYLICVGLMSHELFQLFNLHLYLLNYSFKVIIYLFIFYTNLSKNSGQLSIEYDWFANM